MSITSKQLAELVALAKDGRLIVRAIGRDLSWAPNEFALAQQLVLLAAPNVSRETTGTKKLASLPPASRKRVMEAKASYEKRVAEMEVPTRRKRRKAA
jgi:hypothetical protein